MPMIRGIWEIFQYMGIGIYKIFNIPGYIVSIRNNSASFTFLDWLFTVLTFILTYAIWGILVYMLILLVRKYIRFRRTIVGNEDLLEEIADLHRDVIRLTQEKEKIMALKLGQNTLSVEQLGEIFGRPEEGEVFDVPGLSAGGGNVKTTPANAAAPADQGGRRFFRLSSVDEKYEYYVAPEYDRSMSLSEICDDLRNFACYKGRLFYDIRTIRLMLAGLASTKLILLQGISGTGKTSLPYIMGKYFRNDATIASVQPSWRDRTELFGYFNEFTKKFNETDVLRRIYESTYNDDINIIVLDEMNIARVEYYFAEMLSILEMPDPSEWKIELVASSWENDPKHLPSGKLNIPQNIWYVGTANNDDSTFAVSDKVYDRALVINLDSKGIPFTSPETESKLISYSYVAGLYEQAAAANPVNKIHLDNINKLDLYVIEKFRIAFGNRIMKQLNIFVPVYVACGGTELEGIDYLLATKVFRKFESLNLSLIRDEIKGLISYLDNMFGTGTMRECTAYLQRLQKMY